MNTSESFRALRRANPRAQDGFVHSVRAAADTVHARIGEVGVDEPSGPRRRVVGLSAAGSLAATAVVLTVVTLSTPGGGTGVEGAAAAVKRAAAVTAASAEQSGTAVVRITHDGSLWAGSTIRWNGNDLSVSQDAADRRGKVGSETRVVDGTIYGVDERDGGWVATGSPANIDPDSGTTPAETLAAVREDVGGATLRRFSDGMRRPTTRRVNGSTVYSGTVAAALIARETGFKEGQALRVFPFGYVAHDEASDPAAQLETAVTVGADGVVRQIAVTWGTWAYTVTYRGLGRTPAPVAPTNARSLLEERLRKRR